MHMYFGVCLSRSGTGDWVANAPDLAECHVTGRSAGEALARVRLALEGLIAERLGQERELPEARSLEALRLSGECAGELYSVHINLRHLRALARHQSGRWRPD